MNGAFFMEKKLISWSGGKDALMALQSCLQSELKSNIKLFSILKSEEIAFHGVSSILIEAQARAMQIPLDFIETEGLGYEDVLSKYLVQQSAHDYSQIYFGDIALEDLKVYKESLYQSDEFKLNFPLWKKDSISLMQQFIDRGNEAIIVSCIPELKDFCGASIDEYFLQHFPTHLDACGERGEYHTFVTNAPEFNQAITLQREEIKFHEFETKGLAYEGYFYQKLSLV